MSRESKRRRQKEATEREELLAPDAFQQKGSSWSAWLEKNLKLVLAGVIGVLVLIIGAEILRSTTQGAAADRTRELMEAVDAYREAVSFQAVFTSTSAAAERERFLEARAPLKKVVEETDDAEIQALARLYDADLARRAGLHEEAIAGFDAYLGSSSPEDTLRYFALEGKGYALEARDRLDEALAVYQQIESMERFSDFGLQHAARVLKKKGDLAGAKAAYEKILAREPASPLKELAEQQITLLDG